MFYPSAIRASNPPSTQNEVTSITADPNPEVLPQDPPPLSQQGPTKEIGASQEVSSDKATAIPKVEVASQEFQQDLASTVMPVEGASKDKEGITTLEADKPANQTSKLKIKLKK